VQKPDKDNTLKVFIVGAPRSGTSILLVAIKEIFSLPGRGESHVTPLFERLFSQLELSFDRINKIKPNVLAKELSQLELENHLFEFMKKFYLEQYPQRRWVDKTPGISAILCLPTIERIFPDARLVATRRNGIEVVSSHIKKFRSPFEDACTLWSGSMKALLKARSSCKNLLEVDQYDFQNNTEAVSVRIASHLDSPEHARTFSAYLLAKRVQSSSDHDPTVRLHISDMNWTSEQATQFRRHCGEMMEAFGYEI
jgi:hypothetical protein